MSKLKKIQKIICLVTAGILTTLSLTACSSNSSNSINTSVSSNQPYQQTATMMDTVINLRASGPNAKAAVDEGMKKIDELDKMASTTIATSDIYKVNAAAGKDYVKVHPEILKMVDFAQKYEKLSNGAFDIAIGPIVNLWGIGTDHEKLPSDSEIKALLPLLNYKDVSVDDANSSIKLEKPGMAIDLGGIAKGFAADEVLKIYNKYGIKNGLINLGSSSMYALGKNASNNPWAIGIKNPRDEKSNNYLGIIRVTDKAVSTSGDYERYFIKNGVRYFHEFDANTGYPTKSGVMSVTLIIDSSVPDKNMLADALTKIVFMLGPEKGMQIIDSIPGVSSEATTTDYKVYTSKEFKTYFSNLNASFKLAN